jgi:dUTP pyrophosphatase
MSLPVELKFKKLSDNAITPIKATEYSAGYDLFSAIDTKVPLRGKAQIPIDIAFAIPKNYYGRIAAKSGLALNWFIDIGGGVIDADYRGNVSVIMFNFNHEDFIIKKGMKIAQLIIESIANSQLIECNELDKTVRNDGGFGSSGLY